MLTTNNILNQLPDFIADDPYVKEILSAKEYEFNTLDEVQADILAQFKVDTATWGLTWWERSLGLSTPTAPTGMYRLEHSDPTIKYHGDWRTVDVRLDAENYQNYIGNSDGMVKKANNSNENWLEFAFYGTGFRLLRAAANREKSNFMMTLDGEIIWGENFSNANPVFEWPFFERLDLNPGMHTVRIILNGPNNSINPIVDYFMLDAIEIINSVDTNYELRRKKIKSKLIPLTNVTNDAIRELARAYGFEITIDESVPYVYSIDFNNNANVDFGLRRQLLLDLEQIIPSHIQLDSKFFISTFYDIEQHHLTWDEANKLYVFFDFLTNSKPDIVERYSYLFKYTINSKFNFENFNSDIMQVDNMYNQFVLQQQHTSSSNKIKNKNIDYTLMTPSAMNTKFNDINKKLLTDQKRTQLTRMTTGLSYNQEKISDIVNEYISKRTDLETAIITHPFLARRSPIEVDTTTFTNMLSKTSQFWEIGSYPMNGTNVSPAQIIKGKVAYHQPNSTGGNANNLVKVVGTLETYNPADFYDNILVYPNGLSLNNVVLGEDYIIPKQTDLKPENIKKGTYLFGVKGTMETTPNDYNRGDILFDWQLEDKGDSYKILC